ncbi:MAG: hypothetical protein AMXMBFR44_2740 [Candidatus Campbellbacteria bacterium]
MKKTLSTTLLLSLLATPLLSLAQVNVATSVIQSSVELIWESHAYLPPLYPGKALYPVGGEVTVLALPDASLGSPNTLSYTWKKDGVVDGAQSGTGRRSYTFSGSRFGESPLVTVEVSNGARSEFGSVRIAQTAPFVRFYENKPLQGIAFESTLPKSVATRERTFSIEAYPYFFSASSRGDLRYTWSASGSQLPDATGAALSVQTEEPATVTTQLSVHNVTQVLQRATESLTITFE